MNFSIFWKLHTLFNFFSIIISWRSKWFNDTRTWSSWPICKVQHISIKLLSRYKIVFRIVLSIRGIFFHIYQFWSSLHFFNTVSYFRINSVRKFIQVYLNLLKPLIIDRRINEHDVVRSRLVLFKGNVQSTLPSHQFGLEIVFLCVENLLLYRKGSNSFSVTRCYFSLGLSLGVRMIRLFIISKQRVRGLLLPQGIVKAFFLFLSWI